MLRKQYEGPNKITYCCMNEQESSAESTALLVFRVRSSFLLISQPFSLLRYRRKMCTVCCRCSLTLASSQRSHDCYHNISARAIVCADSRMKKGQLQLFPQISPHVVPFSKTRECPQTQSTKSPPTQVIEPCCAAVLTNFPLCRLPPAARKPPRPIRGTPFSVVVRDTLTAHDEIRAVRREEDIFIRCREV